MIVAILHGLIVFVAALLADVVWARYTISVAAHAPRLAAIWATFIILIGVVNIDAYIASRWFVIPAAAGAAVGTYYTVRHAERRKAEA